MIPKVFVQVFDVITNCWFLLDVERIRYVREFHQEEPLPVELGAEQRKKIGCVIFYDDQPTPLYAAVNLGHLHNSIIGETLRVQK